jgi:solute carrier family 13 (sodium-dependent dicarboxylate transporter), member 2/3/5
VTSAQRFVWRPWGLALGLVLALAVYFADTPLSNYGAHGDLPARAAAIALLMAVWWLTEAIPIYWTACVPLVAFPLFGVFGRGFSGDLAATVLPFLDPYIFLFAGGMAIAAAMQQWNLHRRLALAVMDSIGSDPNRLLAGVLVATAFVSMWISNTATATMMVPIGIALVTQLERLQGVERLARYGMALMLAIAWGANLGGIGTKIGTAPNALLSGFLEQRGVQVSFVQFLLVGVPFVLLMLPVAWRILCRLGARDSLRRGDARDVVRSERRQLGPIGRGELTVLTVFLVTAALWIASQPLTRALAGEVTAFRLRSAHVEGGIAVLAALVLFALRSERRAVLELRSLKTVPWETLLLLGGGFAMAAGIQESGLSGWMANELAAIAGLPTLAQIAAAAVVTVAISAVASNTATVAVMLVVLADAASPEARNAVLFAATLAASCDFALPVGTPPNAIVFGSGYVRIPVMARYGAPFDLVAALAAALWCAWAVPRVLGS